MAEFGQITTTKIAEFNVLQITPNALVRVQIGRVTGQALQVQALSTALRPEGFDVYGSKINLRVK
jgi:hypothetical protein